MPKRQVILREGVVVARVIDFEEHTTVTLGRSFSGKEEHISTHFDVFEDRKEVARILRAIASDLERSA